MNRLPIIGCLLVSTLDAQARQPDAAKLKTDAQKVVSSIRGDKAKRHLGSADARRPANSGFDEWFGTSVAAVFGSF
jgi:hypothetical protein